MILEWEFNGQRQSYRLAPEARVTLGRSAQCTVVLSDPAVSRHHAEIYFQGGTFYIRNVSQTNVAIREYQSQLTHLGYGHEAILPPGSRLQLGSVQIYTKAAPVTLKVRCSGPCRKIVELPRSGFCPHCGTALATADTFAG